MAGRQPPLRTSLPAHPPQPSVPPPPHFVYPFPPAQHLRYKPPDIPPQTFVPQLTYMEGHFATQARLIEQDRRIKALEAELASTQMELIRLRAVQPSSAAHVQSPTTGNPPSHHHPNQQDDTKKTSSRYWTPEEHKRFLDGLRLYGQKDIKSISRHVGTRSATQVRTHAQKYYLRIQRQQAKAATDGNLSPQKCPLSSTKPSMKSDTAQTITTDNLPYHSSSNNSNSHSPSLNNSTASNANIQTNAANTIAGQDHTASSVPRTTPSLSTSAPIDSSSVLAQVAFVAQPTSSPLPVPAHVLSPTQPVSVQHTTPPPPVSEDNTVLTQPTVQTALVSLGTPSITESIPDTKVSKRIAPHAPRRSPRKRTKPSVIPKPEPTIGQCSPTPPPPEQSTPNTSPTNVDATKVEHTEISIDPSPPEPHQLQRSPHEQKPLAHSDNGGSMCNLRVWLNATGEEESGPSACRPPMLRRAGSSNSVLAELSKNAGVLSRSNSFLQPSCKGVTRSNSILSLLSGIPTALRESSSTDRLLALDPADDKTMAILKTSDCLGGTTVFTNQALSASNSIGVMGDRALSFSQLNQIGLDDLEEPGSVNLALQDDQKWGDP